MYIFLIKVLLSGIVGGVWVTATTIAGQRLGSKVGGLIGGMPSVVAVSYFFIGWTQGNEVAYEATSLFPLAYSIGAFCFWVYIIQPAANFGLRLGFIVLLWVGLQTTMVVLQIDNYTVALLIWGVFLASLIIYLRQHGENILVSVEVDTPPPKLWLRVIISGGVIMAAVALSKIGGPVLGSILASFPGVYLSTRDCK